MGLQIIGGGSPFGSLDFPDRYGVTAAEEFSPLLLSPQWWFDVSDPSTLFDSGSGGSLPADDGRVLRLEDKSGNNLHAVTASGNNPYRRVAEKNGLDALAFTGVDFLVTSGFPATQDRTRMAVIASLSEAQYALVFAQGDNGSSPNPGADYFAILGKEIESSLNGGSGANEKLSMRRTTADPASLNSWIVVEIVFSSTHAAHAIYVNGTLAAIESPFTNDPGTYSKASTPLGVGAFNNGSSPSQFLLGEAFEVPRLLTSDERINSTGYLLTKWGII